MLLLLLLLHCLGSGFVLPTADAVAAVMPPGYSWDTLPVHWFSANATGQLDAAAAARIAARHSLVIFNGQSHAYQAPPYGKGSDLWSLGVLLYVILSGCSPFSADEEELLLKQAAWLGLGLGLG